MDAVIAWVDGSDPYHQEKRRRYAGDQRLSYPAACSETRFQGVGEIYFCIASILKYAPFIHRIWIVTDQQKPALLDDFVTEEICAPDRIRVVDHREIFGPYAELLPNFNSLSIEAALWSVPGLAEKFIYLNDDFLLASPCCESDFFSGDQPVIYCDLLTQHERLWRVRVRRLLRRLTFRPDRNVSTMHRASDLAAQLLNEHRFSYVPRHQPHPMRISTQRDFYVERPDCLARQLSFRFRNKDQFLPVALANMLEIREWGGALIKTASVLKYIEPKDLNSEPVMGPLLNLRDEKFLCLQSLDQVEVVRRGRLLQELLAKYQGFYPTTLCSLLQRTADQEKASASTNQGRSPEAA